MSWPPDDLFLGYPGPLEPRPFRPLGQGDIFDGAVMAGKIAVVGGRAALRPTTETVMVVASSCGMRKRAGALNEMVHVAPVKRISSLAPGWSEPWDPKGYLNVMPLPGLMVGNPAGTAGVDLARMSMCPSEVLEPARRLACVSRAGMKAVKARLAIYFTRVSIPDGIFEVGAAEEWNELDLWEAWVARDGNQAGFQEWLDAENPNFAGSARRDSLYDDYAGLLDQLRAKAT
jgi:hypothetical protein